MTKEAQFNKLPTSGSGDDMYSLDCHPVQDLRKSIELSQGIDIVVTKDPDPEAAQVARPKWGSKWDFLMACLSYAVGLGTLWRFPYLVYRHGGGAFLIPYTVMNLMVGVPLFLMEMSLGQFSSSGVINVWRSCPLFKGIGYAMVCVSGILAPYYNLIIAWSLVYLFSSFTSTLPWAHCNNFWNTPNCSLHHEDLVNEAKANCTNIYHGTFYQGVCNYTSSSNESTSVTLHTLKLMSPGDEYFHRGVLDITDGLEVWGGLRWKLCLALLGAWTITFLVIIKGIESSGKVAYFTAVFPYVVLIVLLVRGLTLPGYERGLEFYVKPDWAKLADPKVWGDAAVQVTFSLSCGFGGVLTLASYNNFKNNCIQDTWFICLVTYLTAIFSGFVIFSVLGFMSFKMDKDISEVASQGAGLAFVIYPEAIANMPVAPLWSILFFTMILTLGVGSQIAIVTTVISTIVDSSQLLMDRRLLCTAALCILSFLIGLPLCSGAGMYILQLLDNYVATWSIVIICILECMIITFFYKPDRLLKDIGFMIGRRPSVVWKYCWTVITPLTLLFILISMFVQHAKGNGSSYDSYVYPPWADSLGLFVSFASVLLIPTVAFVTVIKSEGSLLGRIKKLLTPTSDWGPADVRDREDYYHHHGKLGAGGTIPFNPSTTSTTPMLQNLTNPEFVDSPVPSDQDLAEMDRQASLGMHGNTLNVTRS